MSEELYAAAKERVSELLQPINGGVGEDVSYDEKFEEIKNETDKLSALDGDTCDWSSVAVTAEEILTDKSKDFRVAAYYATTKFLDGNLEATYDAFVFMKEMTETFWEDMYPPLRRVRARAGMVGWMSDQAAATVQDIKLKASDKPMVDAIEAVRVAIDGIWRERFGDNYPSMSKLNEAIRHLGRTCPKEVKKEPPKPAAVQQQQQAPSAAAPAPQAAASSGPGFDISTAAAVYKSMTPLATMLCKMGNTLRAEKPEDPYAYKFMRLGAWLELEGAPPTPNDGKSIVPPPPAGMRQRWDGLAASDDWLTLLNEAEAQCGEYILWLDPHRYVSMAMDRLGALFLKAKKEMMTQIAIMLQRCPTLPKIPFNDGTPFADGQTQMWLEGEVLTLLGGDGDGGGGGGGGGGPSVLDEPIQEARGLATKGELGKAIDVVATAAAAAPSPAERFRGSLAVAQLCLQSGQNAIARGQLEGLTKVIDAHHLNSWDPSLCGEVYAALFQAHRASNSGAVVSVEAQAAQDAVFDKLCQLDPGAALKLAKE